MFLFLSLTRFPYLSTSFHALLIPHAYTHTRARISYQRVNYRLTWRLLFPRWSHPRVQRNRIFVGGCSFSPWKRRRNNGNFSQFLRRMERLEARQVGGQREAISRAAVARVCSAEIRANLFHAPFLSSPRQSLLVAWILFATNHPAILLPPWNDN